jgi:uncharacterized protein HemX
VPGLEALLEGDGSAPRPSPMAPPRAQSSAKPSAPPQPVRTAKPSAHSSPRLEALRATGPAPAQNPRRGGAGKIFVLLALALLLAGGAAAVYFLKGRSTAPASLQKP